MFKPFTAPSLSTTLPIPCTFLYLILLLLYSLIILVLLQWAGMKCLYSPKLSQFCLCSFFTFSLRNLFHSLGINYHSYVIAASSYVFKCDLSLVHFPHFHDASISVCLKINSLYLAENYSDAYTIDN